MDRQVSNEQASTAIEPPWSGWIVSIGDALLIRVLEARRRRLIRRLVDTEQKTITSESGSVFVFDKVSETSVANLAKPQIAINYRNTVGNTNYPIIL